MLGFEIEEEIKGLFDKILADKESNEQSFGRFQDTSW